MGGTVPGCPVDAVEQDGSAHLHDQALDRVAFDRGRRVVDGQDLFDEGLHRAVQRAPLLEDLSGGGQRRDECSERGPGNTRGGDGPGACAAHVLGDPGRRDHEPAPDRHPRAVVLFRHESGCIDEGEHGVVGACGDGVDGQFVGCALHRQQEHGAGRSLRRRDRRAFVDDLHAV
ncbi:hypothetical protein [uncultured Microbacterium sp.]|uniref:hypothetical protein n=1 Tax=uncultured Microbacterium sp. TaxID=191216 RepID=UPI0028D89244|nr:hypothetical protein [uncultured Microbacterium sp.]